MKKLFKSKLLNLFSRPGMHWKYDGKSFGYFDKSFEDAILSAFNDAKKTTRGVSGIDVVKFSAKVRDDSIVEFRANIKVSFLVER